MYNKKKYKKFIYVSSILVPIILMCIVYTLLDIYPFGGSRTLFTNDMTYEYISFFSLYKRVLNGEANLFYTFSKVMGGDMAGLWGYYLLSPFNILSIFFKENQIPLFVLLVTLLKIGTSGLLMNMYLNRKVVNVYSLIFSTAYSMMSYNMAYQQNIMWLDGVVVLPLVIWGIEKIVDFKKCELYVVALGCALIANYYTGYMLCLFSVVYFVFYCVRETKKGSNLKSAICLFSISSLLAGGIAAMVLLPVALSLKGGKSEFSIKNLLDFSIQYNPLEILTYLLPGKFKIGAGTFESPYIYCGLIILVFCIYFMCSRKIAWRDKVGNAFLFLVMLCSLMFVNLERLWHGTELPTGYPHRYSFIFSFVLIRMAYCGFSAWIPRKSSCIIINVFSFAELCVNAFLILSCFGYIDRNEYKMYVDRFIPYVEQIQEQDTSFYRMETLTCGMGMNSPAFYGYRGLSSSSSGEEATTKTLAGNLGLNEKPTWIAYHDQMSVGMESLLGLKYIFLERTEKEFYKDLSNGGPIKIYQNPYALSVGMLADKSILQANIDNIDMFAIQNEVWNSILRTDEPLYRNIPAEELYREDDGVTYEFVVDSEDIIYTNFQSEGAVETCDIFVNGEKRNSFYPEKQSFNLGRFQIGDLVRVEIRTTRMNINWYDLFFYYENMEVLEENIARIKQEGFHIEEFRDDFFEGTAVNESDDERYLLFTIPYDNGWKIWVDGVSVEAEKALDSLICLKIPEGKHEIVLKFIVPGLKAGLMISLISTLLFAVVRRKT